MVFCPKKANTLKRLTLTRVVMLAAVVGITGCGQESQVSQESVDRSWAPPALTDEDWVEPDARVVVQRTVDFTSAQQELMTEALVSYEAVQESGQKLRFDLLQRLAAQKPDKLHWVTLNDDGTTDSAWFSDGQFTLLRQPANVWGRVRVPHTIPGMVDRLVEVYDLDVPFGDILSGDMNELWLGEDVTEVWWVGEAWVEGFWTDHVAIRKPGADIELWVRKGNEPFLAKMAVTFTEQEGQPVYTARFQEWATSVSGDIAEFSFTPPPDAEQVEVVPVVGR